MNLHCLVFSWCRRERTGNQVRYCPHFVNGNRQGWVTYLDGADDNLAGRVANATDVLAVVDALITASALTHLDVADVAHLNISELVGRGGDGEGSQGGDDSEDGLHFEMVFWLLKLGKKFL
jgi:hypothetical protein